MEGMDLYAVSMTVVFIIGYFFITIEHITHINKTTVALLMAVICWIIQFANPHWTGKANMGFLGEHLTNISQVVFFLLGALTVVEIINMHKGFRIISDCINVRSKRLLLWVLGGITFFLSAVLDNLTTTIVVISLLKKLIDDRQDRLLIGGALVIAANAGGAWTPIGDVTTTMLWIGGQVSTIPIMWSLLLPSIACMVAAFAIVSFKVKGDFEESKHHVHDAHVEPLGEFIFFLGIGLLVFVPVFKMLTGLPPFMGILFALSILWLVTDIVHCKYPDREHLRVPFVLSRIDLSSTLFFLGILLCIDALDSAKILHQVALSLEKLLGNPVWIATLIGLASAIVDNVPLVAASMGMYSLSDFPPDSTFWQLVAYCAGTGGSILIIGSAAGVVFMGLEKADFFWYMKRISIPALVGYFAGIACYLLFF